MTEQEFWEILCEVPKSRPIFYRLYYNDAGMPVVYTMEDLPGKYIEVDRETYTLAPSNVQVVEGKLVEIVPKTYVRKLTPGSGTPCAPTDVTIVVKQEQPHTNWSISEYETN